MAADSSGFVAGYYTCSWAAADLGITEAGWELVPSLSYEDIKGDQLADTIIDGIWRGWNLSLRATLIEWTPAGRLACQYPASIATADVGNYVVQDIGKTIIGGGFAKQLILTPVANINSNLKTYTFKYCAPSPNSGHGGFRMSSNHRKIMVDLRVYPDRAASPPTMFVVS
jgi:hypothetical protein